MKIKYEVEDLQKIYEETLTANINEIMKISNKYVGVLSYNVGVSKKFHNGHCNNVSNQIWHEDIQQYLVNYLCADIINLSCNFGKDILKKFIEKVNIINYGKPIFKEFEIDSNIFVPVKKKEDNKEKIINLVQSYDVNTNEILNRVYANKEKICIGKAFGIIQILHNMRVERRKAKNKIKKGKIYNPCKEVIDFIENNNIKFVDNIQINKVEFAYKFGSRNSLYYDYLHIIEFSERLNLKKAYNLLMETLKAYEIAINSKQNIKKLNNILGIGGE